MLIAGDRRRRGGLGADGGRCHPRRVVIHDGPARFEVLSPTLIRLEYAEDRNFENSPTLTAARRGAGRVAVTTRRSGGVRVIRTSRAVLRYRLGSGPFGPQNLSLSLEVGGKRRTVTPAFGGASVAHADTPPPIVTPPQPGDPAPRTHGNLGGWYRGLDGQSGPVPLHDGILSRDGWYLLDDTISPLLVEKGRWFAPRPPHDGPYQDGYLFAYGDDYVDGLRDFRDLTGPAPLLPRKAFGNWFSQYTFFSARDYHALLARFRRERVPLDVLVIDTDVKSPNAWNGWQWTPRFGPDPAGFLRWAHSKGLEVGLNVHPSISLSDPSFAAANAAAAGLAPDSGRCFSHVRDANVRCAVFDWARRDQAAAYFDLHAPFESQGVDFWWLDWNSDESDAQAPGLTPDAWINSLYAAREAARGAPLVGAEPDRVLVLELRRRDARRVGRASQRDPLHRRRAGHVGHARLRDPDDDGRGSRNRAAIRLARHRQLSAAAAATGPVRPLGSVRRLPADPAPALRPR